MDVLAAAVFAVTIALIVSRYVDEVAASLAGVTAMVLLTAYTPEEAFNFVEWNVIAILLGMWIIAGYMIEGGFTEATIRLVSRGAGSYRRFLLYMALLSGFISMFIDNVLVILLVGSLTIAAAKKAGGNPVLAILLVGFSANFMGTALLMGDLPPQLLHSVAGAEFLDFIWTRGKPGSFPLLTVTFILTLAVFYILFIRREPDSLLSSVETPGAGESRRTLLLVSLAFFSATVAAMAVRPLIGLPLGFITMAGASALALTVEILKRIGVAGMRGFDDALKHVEWRALLFYAALFALVGGLESGGVIEEIALRIVDSIAAGELIGYSIMYWAVGLLSLVIEHDALLLTFLYIVRDAATIAGVDPWSIYWGMAWSATLASNATTAAAPALYVAVAMADREGYRVKALEFLKYSLTFAISSLLIHYLLTILLWV
ncbi:ArsB/NhaD family transporter [Aeropyrum camini]|uniref:Na+ antiporter NhaD n=1 Tax=Aeropyrum camini SY1 = JCM 12091 TaxID=1198449 RepID=U3T7L7_9CREN|nr:ArsB/NhaD family transporter [Aeropyrum camini]BAN89512.1 Na+ antiporter NhaD [Aeropyrum camini SY1 = JCM 12091]